MSELCEFLEVGTPKMPQADAKILTDVGCGNMSCVTGVRRNYHLCGDKARTSCINLNNVWKKYSMGIYIQEKNVCVQ